MKKEGVPVEAKVAAIFLPTRPDLPIPEIIVRPLQERMRLTALSNSLSMREDMSSSASDCAFRESTAIERKSGF